MWPSYVHQLALHFPIVLSLVLTVMGWRALRVDNDESWNWLRVLGGFAWVVTTIAAISGLVAADPFWTEEGPELLIHHRNLGILGWVCTTVAAGALEYGVRNDEVKLRRFSALAWTAVAVAMIGAGHWGGSGVHSDIVPWQGDAPIIRPAHP